MPFIVRNVHNLTAFGTDVADRIATKKVIHMPVIQLSLSDPQLSQKQKQEQNRNSISNNNNSTSEPRQPVRK
jgi:hypothetical protein